VGQVGLTTALQIGLEVGLEGLEVVLECLEVVIWC